MMLSFQKLLRMAAGLLFCLALMPVSTMAAASSLPEFRDIVKSNSPAVVKILVEASSSNRRAPDNLEIPEYLRRFFEFREAPPGGQQRMSMGSGFVFSKDGYIVTNNHVVEGADSVLVRFSDRQEYDAEIVGTDPRSDLALLKIDGSGLPTLQLASRDSELEVGEWVLAIGSPFGLDYSVTAGIVSAKGRSLPTERNENYVPFIQTDVAINPGNSGGPLFNLEGEVVGVNSQIYTRSGGSIGLSFAIPVEVVRNVIGQLKERGEVVRGWLGVTIQDVDRTLAESFGLDKPRGALVTQLSPNSPAEKAGIESGDIIVNFDGEDIMTSADLPHVVGLIAPGTRVDVEVVRDRKRRQLKVEVGGLDADQDLASRSAEIGDQPTGRLGVVVEDALPEVIEKWGISGGVVVREVIPDSVASDAGIVAGDVITLVGSTPIKSLDSFEEAVSGLESGQSVPLRLIRRGSPMFIGLKLD